MPLPSFHRPDLVNFWYHRLLTSDLADRINIDAEYRRAGNYPARIEPDGTPFRQRLRPQQAALISAIKRQIMLRPIREDHPHFDGSNPFSVPESAKRRRPQVMRVGDRYDCGAYWEVVGPWDVDNDNDGVPRQRVGRSGRRHSGNRRRPRYKPLYAFLCVDLDSRLNVNAHGSVDDVNAWRRWRSKRRLSIRRVGEVNIPGANLGRHIAVPISAARPRLRHRRDQSAADPLAATCLAVQLAANIGIRFNGLLDADDYARLLFAGRLNDERTRWQSEYRPLRLSRSFGVAIARRSAGVKPGTTYNGHARPAFATLEHRRTSRADLLRCQDL